MSGVSVTDCSAHSLTALRHTKFRAKCISAQNLKVTCFIYSSLLISEREFLAVLLNSQNYTLSTKSGFRKNGNSTISA